MYGATVLPDEATKIQPATTKIKTIGSNHSFFLTLKNVQSSIINFIY